MDKYFTETLTCLSDEYKFVKGANNINFEELEGAYPDVKKRVRQVDNVMEFNLTSSSYMQLKMYVSNLKKLIQKANIEYEKVKLNKKRFRENEKIKKKKRAEKEIINNINNIQQQTEDNNKSKEQTQFDELFKKNRFYGLDINCDCL